MYLLEINSAVIQLLNFDTEIRLKIFKKNVFPQGRLTHKVAIFIMLVLFKTFCHGSRARCVTSVAIDFTIVITLTSRHDNSFSMRYFA